MSNLLDEILSSGDLAALDSILSTLLQRSSSDLYYSSIGASQLGYMIGSPRGYFHIGISGVTWDRETDGSMTVRTQGHVDRLDFHYYGDTGDGLFAIPSEIGELTGLRYLELSGNPYLFYTRSSTVTGPLSDPYLTASAT